MKNITKKTVSLFFAAVMMVTMSFNALAADIPVIDMGTFHNVYVGSPSGGDHSLGEFKTRAHVTLENGVLEKGMFTCTLYEVTDSGREKVAAVSNDENGTFTFPEISVHDLSKPVKLVAVLDEKENMKNKTGTLEKTVEFKLDNEGNLKIKE